MLESFAHRTYRSLWGKNLLAVGLFLGFSSLSAAAPKDGLESEVRDCQFLGKVEGWSGYGKHLPGWEPLAKASALQRAEHLGATNIVWERMIDVGAFNGRAVARAYQCNGGNLRGAT